MRWWQRILPPTKLERDLVWQCVLSAFATGTFLTGTAVYFTQVVGLSGAQVGLGMSVTAGVTPPNVNQPNIVALGELMYTRFLMPFELAGLILLVAMIGAIVLTHRSRPGVRGQNIPRQVDRVPGEAVKNMQPEVGEGMTL